AAAMAQVSRLTIRLHDSDEVVIARAAILAGTPIEGEGVVAAAPIPAGHKIAARDLAAGQPVRKYGQIIGFASEPIAAGQHVHAHNLGLHAFERDYAA